MEASLTRLPPVVIVGRPNVGKSTLFNRITGNRRSIVGDEPGITRDRILLEASWNGRPFLLTDTGGMLFGTDEEFPQRIAEQVEVALEDAAQVIFVLDGRSEITATDRELADLLRRSRRPVTVAVNKCDTPKNESLAADFFALGFEHVFPVSAEHGRGIGELLDHVTAEFPEGAFEEPQTRPIRVAIIGRPNAGKSTLLNRLAGAERAIVSPIPGTTRDAVDTLIESGGRQFQIVDTAGIRRKSKTAAMAEKLSVMMAQRHIRMADVVLLLIDATEGATHVDASIAGYAQESGRGVILVVNKWDLHAHGEQQYDFAVKVRDTLRFLDYAPMIFLSALSGRGAQKLFPAIVRVYDAARQRVPTSQLNRFVENLRLELLPTPSKSKPKVRFVTQASVAPPTFVFFTSSNEKLPDAVERHVVRQFRKEFGFEGVPLVIRTRRSRPPRAKSA